MSVVPRLVEMGVVPESAVPGDVWEVDDAIARRLLSAARLAQGCASNFPKQPLEPPGDFWRLYIPGVDWPGRWLCDCVFGDPFRFVAVDGNWLKWNDATVPHIAQAIYDDRAFDRLPVLADALEEAGCTDAAILDHCRGPVPHVRGCWVVDLLLGKE